MLAVSAVTNGDSEQTAGAMVAVTQGWVVVRGQLVRTGSCWRWCGSFRQGTVDAQGSATAAVEAVVCRAPAVMAQEEAGEGRRWCERKANLSPLLIAKPR